MHKQRKNTPLRKLIRNLHKILGLSSGIVVFIVSVTGCFWVFKQEIDSLLDDGTTHVQEQAKPFITPTKARQIADQVFSGRHVHGTVYGNPEEAVEVIYYEAEPEFYRSVFLNPYSGEVLKTQDHLSGFFAFILDGHLNLWLPESVGNEVVRWACVIFVALLISGIFLWWPRNKKNKKQRFSFQWKDTTQWKRKNFDLHSIVGFYASFLALLLAMTGLIMAFDFFAASTYKALGGEKEDAFSIPNGTPIKQEDSITLPIDRLIPALRLQYPNAMQFEVHYPYTDSASIYVEITYKKGVYYSSDYRFYDQNTLQEVQTASLYGVYEEADLPDKVMRMVYDTHVGAILGLPGKIVMFLASLMVASLPITGFMIWWGRKRKPSSLLKKVDKKVAVEA